MAIIKVISPDTGSTPVPTPTVRVSSAPPIGAFQITNIYRSAAGEIVFIYNTEARTE